MSRWSSSTRRRAIRSATRSTASSSASAGDEGRSAARIRQRGQQGRVSHVGPTRSVTRSGPDGTDGFLLPYHAYLAPTGDAEEDARRKGCCARSPSCRSPATRGCSRTSRSTRRRRRALDAGALPGRGPAHPQHGIAEGPWEHREEWLNQQIARTWVDRGAFPGLGCGAGSARHAARDGARARTRSPAGRWRPTPIPGRSSKRCPW